MALPHNFRWAIRDRLAGCGTPSVLELSALADAGIGRIVSLQKQAEYYDKMAYTADDAASYGLSALHLPIDDFSGPNPEQVAEFFDFVDKEPATATAVHCYMGIGRTGTMLAIYLGRAEGLNGAQAISRIRELSPEYIQTIVQEATVIRELG